MKIMTVHRINDDFDFENHKCLKHKVKDCPDDCTGEGRETEKSRGE